MKISKFIDKYKGMFSHSEVGKFEIFINIIKLLFYKLIKKRFVVKNIYNNKLVLDFKTIGISKFLFIYGKREVLHSEVTMQEVKEGMNVLDLGANIGYYAILEASLIGDGKVYAFEPDQRNVELLEKNIKLNNFSDKIKVYPYAGAEKNCIRPFNLYKETNLNTLVDRGGESKSVPVKCIKLDDFSEIDKIDFIRMDIEGYECLVIDGMIDFLKRKENIKLQIEVHPRYYDNNEFDFNRRLALLKEIGFRVKYLISTGVDNPKKILDSGYQPIKSATEGGLTRTLSKNVEMDDLMRFINNDTKLVRSILLEKN